MSFANNPGKITKTTHYTPMRPLFLWQIFFAFVQPGGTKTRDATPDGMFHMCPWYILHMSVCSPWKWVGGGQRSDFFTTSATTQSCWQFHFFFFTPHPPASPSSQDADWADHNQTYWNGNRRTVYFFYYFFLIIHRDFRLKNFKTKLPWEV